MKQQDKVILLIAVAVLVAAGVLQFQFGSPGDSPRDTSMKVAQGGNQALKSGLVSVYQSRANIGDWSCPHWSIASVGAKTARSNHPLYRRPRYIGENRHKVMCEGWGGWYYNPPSEAYF